MSDSTDLREIVNGEAKAVNDEFAWGAVRISRVINQSPRQTHHLLAKNLIKCAKKIGGRYVAHIPTLRREFGGES